MKSVSLSVQVFCCVLLFVMKSVSLSVQVFCCVLLFVMKSVSLSVQVFCCVLLFVMKAVSLSVQVFCCVLLQQATPHFRCFAVLMNFLVTLTAWTLVMVKCSFLQPLSQTFCLSWSYCSYVNEFYGQPALYLTWFFMLSAVASISQGDVQDFLVRVWTYDNINHRTATFVMIPYSRTLWGDWWFGAMNSQVF